MITTYAELQTAAAAEAQRRDLATQLPELVQLAETAIFRDLEVRDLVATASGITTGDTITPPNDIDRIDRVSVTVDGRDRTLYYTPMTGQEGYTAYPGSPMRCAFENGLIRLLPSPGPGAAYTIYYAPRLPPLSDTNPSNWLLANAPDVYLSRTVMQIGVRVHDDALVQRHGPIYAAAMESVRSKSERQRLPRTGGLQIRPWRAR